MFSDGVTEARDGLTRDLYGDERLRSLVARLGDLTAAAMADAIRSATVTFSGGRLSDGYRGVGAEGSDLRRPGASG